MSLTSPSTPPSNLTKHIEIARLLLALPSDLITYQEQKELGPTTLDFLPLYYLAATKLLRDDAGDVPVECWRMTYCALALGLRHDKAVSPTRGAQKYTHEIAKLSQKGILHKTRSVRIAAGLVSHLPITNSNFDLVASSRGYISYPRTHKSLCIFDKRVYLIL
jgi:hypothetical protein